MELNGSPGKRHDRQLPLTSSWLTYDEYLTRNRLGIPTRPLRPLRFDPPPGDTPRIFFPACYEENGGTKFSYRLSAPAGSSSSDESVVRDIKGRPIMLKKDLAAPIPPATSSSSRRRKKALKWPSKSSAEPRPVSKESKSKKSEPDLSAIAPPATSSSSRRRKKALKWPSKSSAEPRPASKESKSKKSEPDLSAIAPPATSSSSRRQKKALKWPSKSSAESCPVSKESKSKKSEPDLSALTNEIHTDGMSKTPCVSKNKASVGKVVTPRLKKVVTPRSKKVVTPRLNEMVIPRLIEMVVPGLNNVVTPRLNTVTPRLNKVTTPRLNNLAIPRLSNLVTPRLNDVVSPRSNNVVTPRLNRNNRPRRKVRAPSPINMEEVVLVKICIDQEDDPNEYHRFSSPIDPTVKKYFVFETVDPGKKAAADDEKNESERKLADLNKSEKSSDSTSKRRAESPKTQTTSNAVETEPAPSTSGLKKSGDAPVSKRKRRKKRKFKYARVKAKVSSTRNPTELRAQYFARRQNGSECDAQSRKAREGSFQQNILSCALRLLKSTTSTENSSQAPIPW